MIDEISGDYLQWLRGFYFVAEKGNLQQASIAMGREKATISRQIQCLEKELGVTLFDRSSGKMMITHEGKILREKADELFEYVKRIKDDFTDEEITYQGMINIAATHGVIYNFLLPYVDHFRRLHPKVAFQIEGDNREVVYNKVESAEAGFGIGGCETGHKAIEFHDLYESSRMLIAPKDNPYFTGKKVPTLKQIAEAPLIITAYNGLSETSIEKLFVKDRLKPNVVMRHNNFFTTKKSVALGMGVAILGEICISQEDEHDFDIYNLGRYLPKRKYGILLKKRKYLSVVIKAFLRTIKQDIDFSANPIPPEAPVVSLTELLQRRVGLNLNLNQAEVPAAKAGRRIKRGTGNRGCSSPVFLS